MASFPIKVHNSESIAGGFKTTQGIDWKAFISRWASRPERLVGFSPCKQSRELLRLLISGLLHDQTMLNHRVCPFNQSPLGWNVVQLKDLA